MTPQSVERNIEAALDRLVEALHPERIILFGSHVWGSPTVDSDLDFLVILRESDLPPHKRAQLTYRH